MRAKHTLTALAVLTMTMYGTAYAQTGTPGTAAPAASTADGASQGTSADQQQSSQMLASELIGMPVRNGTGDKAENIGKITDLVLDRGEKTVNVLIGVGGFLGIGTKDVGVPLDKVQFNPGAKTAVVDMSKEQLQEAPAYVTLEDKKAKETQAAQPRPAPAPMGAPAAPGGGTGTTQ